MLCTSLRTVCLVSMVAIVTACILPESIDSMEHRLEREHSLVISAGDPDSFFVPPYTEADAKIPEGKVLAASPRVMRESLQGIEDALNCYPEGFVSSLIDAIFISGEMWFDGQRAGGTYGSSWLIIASSTKREGYESNYETAYYGVHHELSSFVFNQLPIIGFVWAGLMPIDWNPATSYLTALSVDSFATPDYANGFLSKYAETSVENDFNTYAEFAFGNPDKLAELAGEHPLIAKKLRLFIGAYTVTSPAMVSIFKQSSLGAFTAPPELIEMILKIVMPKATPRIIEK